jgi:hypothetical protein
MPYRLTARSSSSPDQGDPIGVLSLVVRALKTIGAKSSILILRFKLNSTQTGQYMAKPNYSYAKRQREIAKKQKKEEKRQQKLAEKEPETAGEDLQESADAKSTDV